MNTIIVSGFLGKVKRISDKFGVATVKELTRRKGQNGQWEKGKTFHDVLLFERDLNFVEQYVEEGRFCTVYGELVIEQKEQEDGTKRKYVKIIPREITWAPGESRDAQKPAASSNVAPADSDDIPF